MEVDLGRRLQYELETRRAILLLLHTPQLNVDLKGRVLLDSLRVQKGNTPIRVSILQLLPVIFQSSSAAHSTLTVRLCNAALSLTQSFGTAMAVGFLDKVSKRRERGGDTANAGFNIGAQQRVGYPDYSGMSVKSFNAHRRNRYSQGRSAMASNLFTYGILTIVMIEATEAKDNSPKACNLACLFICVFQSMIAGTTTNAKSVKIVLTVATWPIMTNVSTGAHFPLPLMTSAGVHIASTG
jgi:hypothetical protein